MGPSALLQALQGLLKQGQARAYQVVGSASKLPLGQMPSQPSLGDYGSSSTTTNTQTASACNSSASGSLQSGASGKAASGSAQSSTEVNRERAVRMQPPAMSHAPESSALVRHRLCPTPAPEGKRGGVQACVQRMSAYALTRMHAMLAELVWGWILPARVCIVLSLSTAVAPRSRSAYAVHSAHAAPSGVEPPGKLICGRHHCSGDRACQCWACS